MTDPLALARSHRATGPGPRAPAPPPGRGRHALDVTRAMLSALVLVVSGTAWVLTGYVDRTVGRTDAGTAGTAGHGPLTLLVAGVDVRAGLTAAQQRELHVGHVTSTNSDTMMIVHVSADRTRVTVVSLPRDSWVNIPGHGMGKINAAFGIGGPRLAVTTVEHATGLTINDFIEINFIGFVTVIDALGGVDICLPQPLNDPYTGLHLSAGVHHVNGVTALKYARDRHSFATSDLARMTNQQSMLASLLREAISSGTLAHPLRLSAFLRAALGAIKVDRHMNITALADQLRGVSLSRVRFLTVPIANADYQTPGGESAVRWDTSAARRIFTRLKADRPLSSPGRAGAGQHTPAAPVRGPAGSRTAKQASCR